MSDRPQILVALDGSPAGLATLAAASQIAARQVWALTCLFVEDEGLLHLCDYSFVRAVSPLTAAVHELERQRMEQAFRRQAAQLEQAVASATRASGVPWRFQVVRGQVTRELLAAVVGSSPGKRIGGTAQALLEQAGRPVLLQGQRQRPAAGQSFIQQSEGATVISTGSAASHRAIQLAMELFDGQVTVVTALPGLAPATLHRQIAGAAQLFLPLELAAWLDNAASPVIVVP
jgi:nucleotide-binding universal stress UspA family protein